MFTILNGIQLHVANHPACAPRLRTISLIPHHEVKVRGDDGPRRQFVAKSAQAGNKEKCYLTIELDKPADYVYQPGQNVTGHISLHSEGGIAHFRSLSVTFRGVESQVDVVNERKYLIPPSHDRYTLKEGKHDLKFKFHLHDQEKILHYFIEAELDQSTCAKKAHIHITPMDIQVAGSPMIGKK